MAQVIIRKKAEKKLVEILEYAYLEYGQRTLNSYISELDQIEWRLSHYPESYPVEPLLQGKKHQYRGCTLKKNFKLIYYYNSDSQEVIIQAVWDIRMNPERLVRII